MTTFADVERIDSALASAGHHALTDFWRSTLERFYNHPTARTLVGRIGRGGAKSFTSAKVGLVETLLGDYLVPPGERHYFAYVSKNKDEANQRLGLLQSFLKALGVPFSVSGDEIALSNVPRGFRVFAAQIGAVSGFRCFGYAADELAKWIAGHDYSNPASEVCASLNEVIATGESQWTRPPSPLLPTFRPLLRAVLSDRRTERRANAARILTQHSEVTP